MISRIMYFPENHFAAINKEVERNPKYPTPSDIVREAVKEWLEKRHLLE